MTNKVQLLSDDVIKKIAAGEVVERPASVVKELVENSLDAGAKKIVIDLEEGGTKRITIEDDGCGMSPEDCVLSLSRHATSKIRNDEDLFAINTFGFRGEALAAISAVSNFTLCSRVRGSETGCKVYVENGQAPLVTSWMGAQGTLITVSNLFCTVPVRAKFLKSPETELAHGLDLIQALALASPKVSFSLIHNGKVRFSAHALEGDKSTQPWRGESLLRERWESVVGSEEAKQSIYVREENSFGRWEALISAPGRDKASHKHIFHFVNGRWVKDKVLHFGIQRGYHSHLMKGRYPQVLSFFDCDPSLIDVNVHPAKTELRFQYPAEVQGLLSLAIRKHLREASWVTPGTESNTSSINFEKPIPFKHSSSFERRDFSYNETPVYKMRETVSAPPRKPEPEEVKQVIFTPSSSFVEKKESELEGNFLGTFAKCYLLFETEKNELLAVDQHAFHERILYERLCKNLKLLSQSQPLMLPEALTLSSDHVETLKENKALLSESGFSIEFLNENTVEIRAVPTLLVHKNYEGFFLEFSEKLSRGTLSKAEEIHHELLASLACHAAVRAGEELTHEQVRLLMNEAKTVDFYHNCPHGRRVFKYFDKSQVASWFDR